MVLNILDFHASAFQSDSKDPRRRSQQRVGVAQAAAGQGHGLPSYEAVEQHLQMQAADEVTVRATNGTWQDMTFSMDMLTCAQREANFLRMLDRKAPVLYEDEVTRNAVRRYEQFWLPLQVRCAHLHLSELTCQLPLLSKVMELG